MQEIRTNSDPKVTESCQPFNEKKFLQFCQKSHLLRINGLSRYKSQQMEENIVLPYCTDDFPICFAVLSLPVHAVVIEHSNIGLPVR
jgi:hypothetical protein